MSAAHDAIVALRNVMEQAVIGQQQVVQQILLCLLCNGNILLEGLPGTAKTRSVKSLAKALSAELGRIQFTPDLLPSDVTGTETYHNEGGRELLTFQPGPLFNNLVLADEINRAPAKVQAALLEAMEERQVTVAGKTYPLPELFMVLATQNPIDQEGTYPLPEAQMDRFLMKVNIDYPNDEAELEVIRLVRTEERAASTESLLIAQQQIFDARRQIQDVYIAEAVERYIVSLVMATRHAARLPAHMAQWIETGASPRASIALDRAARAQAWLAGKDFVDPDDVRAVVFPVLRHRMILGYEAAADGVSSDQVITEILKHVAVA